MIRAVIFDMYETLVTHYESPLYFSEQIAEDAGIPVEDFRSIWCPTEDARSTGKITLDRALEIALRENGRYSEKLLDQIMKKRIRIKQELFRRMHPEIIPMLSRLKEKGVLIGLISNCFSEEAKVIRESILFSYFDAVCLSYEQGVQKPDREIFDRCIELLSVSADECLYVGDGGSRELEAARELGMKAVQAVWYLKEHIPFQSPRNMEFIQAEAPLDIINFIG